MRFRQFAAVVGLAVALLSMGTGTAAAVDRAVSARVDCTSGSGGAVRELRVPIGRATAPTVHAAGRRVVVLARRSAGSSTSIVGVVLDCTRRRWTAMPDAPFPSDLASRGVVWTGRELLVVGVPCSPDYTDVDLRKCDPPYVRAAAWSPRTNRWRTVRLTGSSFGARRWPAGTTTVGLGMNVRGAVFEFEVSGGARLAFVDPRTGATKVTERFGHDLTPCVADGRVTLSRGDGVTRVLSYSGWSTGSAPAAGSVRVECGHGMLTASPQLPRTAGVEDAIQAFDPYVSRWKALPPSPVAGYPGDAIAAPGAVIALAFGSPPSVWTTDIASGWRAHPLPPGWSGLDARSSPQAAGLRFVVAPSGGRPRIGILTP